MSIKPDYLSFSKLLQERLFRIPDYQRHYSWESKQREDLFSDIKKLKDIPDRDHFMATVVCLNKNLNETVGSDQFSVLDIVDGQQRITTLIILLKAISKELNNGTEIEESKRIDEMLIKKDRRLILLHTNHDYSHFFEKYLEEGIIPKKSELKTIADSHIFDAYNDCENFIKDWKSEDTLINLLKILKNKLYFILIILEDEGSVYTVFEVLNSRGLEVDWLDKCKSSLMGLLFENNNGNKQASGEHLKELHKIWTEIYRVIGLTKVPGHEIIRFAATLKYEGEASRTLGAEDALDILRTFCSKSGKDENTKNIKDITQWLLKVTQKLVELYKNKRLKAVTEITQARLLAIAILLREDLDNDTRNKLLEQWERMTFRIFGMNGKDARVKVGDYVRTAQTVYNKKENADSLLEKIKKIGCDYPIDGAIKALVEKPDFYKGWEEELRYFYYRYEEDCAIKQGGKLNEPIWKQIWEANVSTTIEHIYPKGDNTSKLQQWRGKGSDTHVNRLGNLILLPPSANSEAGQKSFTEKKEIYNKNYMFIMQDILKLKDWDKESIEERETDLLKWAKVAWDDL